MVLRIQCAWRQLVAKKKTHGRKREVQREKARHRAATSIQKVARGGQGRSEARIQKEQYLKAQKEKEAATKLQAMARRDAASKRVNNIRAQKLARLNHAATTIRKMWVGSKTRRRYRLLLEEFSRHVKSIVTLQRYSRGCLVRLRIWRHAKLSEEQLWASIEIQRCWRGYRGRVAWEQKYEEVWTKEMASVRIQRHIRGWLARTKVGRRKRHIARAEFERARRRFYAAQRLQALVRGVSVRKAVCELRRRKDTAAAAIQKIVRGRAVRWRMQAKARLGKLTRIQAAIRGFLVRRRKFHVAARVICIQRTWRLWMSRRAGR